MTRAGFFAHDEPEPNVAAGYTTMTVDGEKGESYRSNIFVLPARGNSAGSAQATAEDLWHFDTALRNHKLLPPAYTSWYFGGAEPTPGETGAGNDKPAMAAVGIAGGAPGVSATLESDGELAVMVLSNYDAPITEDITRALYRPLRRALSEGN
jgi:CubicO group peptidase (beta-lactamase class C family)